MEIKKNEIYAIKLTCGQEIVAKVLEIGDDGFHLAAPLTIGQSQQGGMEFLPAMFTAEFGTEAFMHNVGIAMILPCRKDVKEAYKESIDPKKIVTQGKKQIITG